MATKVPIDLQLNPKSKAMMKRLEKHAKSLSLMNSFRVIGMSYRKEVKGIFEQKQVRDASLKWPALKEATEKQKARQGYGSQPILVRNEDLKKSMITAGAKDNISHYGHKNAFFGSSVPYGKYHDNLDEPRSKIPLRNFSQPSESTYGSWLNTIDADIIGQLKSQGISTE